jgi:hypothetical protein
LADAATKRDENDAVLTFQRPALLREISTSALVHSNDEQTIKSRSSLASEEGGSYLSEAAALSERAAKCVHYFL